MSLTPAPSTRALPVADRDSVKEHTRGLLRRHRGSLLRVIGLHAVAAGAALVAPRVIGLLVDEISHGRSLEVVDRLALWIAGAVVVQTAVTWFARRASFVMGETIFAELREQFMERVVELPLSTVERAGTGDLVSRTTNDVEALSHVIRFGIPSIFVGAVTTTITVVAAFLTGWQVALAIVVGVPILVLSTRRYLRHAPGRLPARAGHVRRAQRRRHRVRRRRPHRRRPRSARPSPAPHGRGPARLLRRRALHAEAAHAVVPVGGVRLLRAGRRHAALGRLPHLARRRDRRHRHRRGALRPADGRTRSTSSSPGSTRSRSAPPRSPGSSASPTYRPTAPRPATEPADDHLEVEDVHYSYRAGRDVLHGVSLDLRPGERLAIVGPVRRRQVDARTAHGRHRRSARRAASTSAACASSTSSSPSCAARSRS